MAGTDQSGSFALQPELPTSSPDFERAVAALSSSTGYVSTKINHGFWEGLAKLDRLGFPPHELHRFDGAEVDRALGIAGRGLAEGGFLQELFDELATLPAPATGFDFAAALLASPLADRIVGRPFEKRAVCEAMIERFVPKAHRSNIKRLGLTGHGFKLAMMAGRFAEFSEPLAREPFVLIANAMMHRFPELIGATEVHSVEIDGRRARFDREAIFEATLRQLDATPGLRRVVMQAGGSLSTWLCARLARARPDLQIFDIGNAMTVADPALAMRSNWVKYNAPMLARSLETLHPGWLNAPRDAGGTPSVIQSDFGPLLRDEALVSIARGRGVAEPSHWDEQALPAQPDAPVAFVENKSPDLIRVGQFLELSERANHHANGGPVSALLESAAAHLTGLPEHREAVAVSSATVGLQLACAAKAQRRGQRRMRWVTSAYTFFSARIGSLADTLVIDCLPDGNTDLDKLKSLQDEEWDGLIHTNLFGQCSNWSAIRDYCAERGKAFVVDNAVGLLDRADDAHAAGDTEVISCHHTKPWGMGEGGLVLADREEAEVIRKLANFGVKLPEAAAPFATNGKLSDLAAAAILDRLERMVYWAVFYHKQRRRILSVIAEYDLPFSAMPAPRSPQAFVPLLAETTVASELLKTPHVVLRKYYKPHRLGKPGSTADHAQRPSTAERLFSRILCCPLNPKLRRVASENLAEALRFALTPESFAGPRKSE